MMILARVAQQEHPHLVPGRTILVVGMDIIIMTTHEQPLQRHTSLFLRYRVQIRAELLRKK